MLFNYLVTFSIQLWLTLTVFLSNISCSLFNFGKCLSNKWKNIFPTFMVTFQVNGGLNHIIFPHLLLLFPRVFLGLYFRVDFFLSGFSSQTFALHRAAGEVGGYLFSSSLPLPPASKLQRNQLGDYCIELTSALSQQPDLNQIYSHFFEWLLGILIWLIQIRFYWWNCCVISC